MVSCNLRAVAEAPQGTHDILLMLPNGPLHIRFNVTSEKVPLNQVRKQYMQQLIAALDVDQDGALTRIETAKHPLFVNGRRFEGNSFLDSLRKRRPYTQHDIEMAIDRAAGQLVTFRQNDALVEQDLSVFKVLDSDESGLIDRAEMRMSPARIAERDLDFDQCITFDEFLNQNIQDPNLIAISAINGEPPAAVHSDLLRDAREPLLAARLVRRYDTDRDAHLSAIELGWSAERAKTIDSDANQLLSMQELSAIPSMTPDLSLEVDLAAEPNFAMKTVGTLDRSIEVARADLVKLRRTTTMVSFGYRSRDPMAEAKQNANLTFNAIDLDANGYLDRGEIVGHQRFENYLFDAMDHDSDERVFASEMDEYVRLYTEPATTTCQITLLDTGNGFFQILDANADGRISIRELRTCESQLLRAARDEPSINPSQLLKSYRVEIQRGGVSLFGRVDRPSTDIPTALLKPPSGPMWFQRMDRNGDGDLTWDEFLGPRDVFHRIDIDHDDLIDEHEATQTSKNNQ